MGLPANFVVLKDVPDRPLLIQDVGPWDRHLTVTNDAENVVATLVKRGLLPPGRRLLYVDSDGMTDEIVVMNGRFVGFAFPPP